MDNTNQVSHLEIFDVVDDKGIPTGETIERKQAHTDGIRHRTAHIWIVRKHEGKYQVLLQKRAMDKDSFPGCYDTSSSGHIQAGDEPLVSAMRELYEELGIKATEDELQFAGNFYVNYEKEFHGKLFKDNEVAFVYIYSQPVDVDSLTLQKEEVDAVEWFDVDYVVNAINPRDSRFCVPTGGFMIAKKWCDDMEG